MTTDPLSYWVPSHVRVCVTASGSVALDLKRSRYIGLGDFEARSLAALARNWSDVSAVWHDYPSVPADEARTIAAALVTTGMLTDHQPTDEVHRGAIDRPPVFTSVGFEVDRQPALRGSHLIHFARAYVWARRSSGAQSMEATAAQLREARADCAEVDAERLIDAVSTFRRLRPYSFATREKCFLHALALSKFLAHQGVHAALVIAVRPRPWSAHSWVECGPLLLDAKPDEIAGFFPITTI